MHLTKYSFWSDTSTHFEGSPDPMPLQCESNRDDLGSFNIKNNGNITDPKHNTALAKEIKNAQAENVPKVRLKNSKLNCQKLSTRKYQT